MAIGRLGNKRIDGVVNLINTTTELYVCPLTTLTLCTINVCNRNTEDALVSVSIGTVGSGTTTADYLVYNAIVNGKETVELTGIVISDNQVISVSSDSTNVNFAVWGMEETNQGNVTGGRLAALNIGSANTLYPHSTTSDMPAILYKVTSTKGASANLVICNRNVIPATVKVAYVDADVAYSGDNLTNLVDEDWIEELSIPARMYFERSGLVVKTGHTLVVESNLENVNFVLTGVLE